LGAQGAAPEEERGAGDAVVDELGGGDQVDEPGEDGGGAVGDLQEGEEGDGEDGEDGVDWDAVAGCSTDGLVGVVFRWLWLKGTCLVRILGALPSSARPKSDRDAQ